MGYFEKGIIAHHGIIGQKWGVRRFQNEDGTLTPAGQARRDRRDARWVDRNANRLYKKVMRKSRREINRAERRLNYTAGLRTSRSYMIEHNRRMAEIMNKHAAKLPTAPSGKVIKFIAKRGEIGVHMALADPDYDMSQVKNGVYSSGRVAYKKKELNRM